ncbi:Pentatricopeptide repeat-containing protein [Acorus calamus]|uniref:Pentatricopeptide repeat-containing protein n=1 Tax=Acorus calamus TaxID=4465 RepID=A0AAV9EPE5_ACOCL|nr:Pentatricopeptide repeat-containing protein [Acorus calamus]
MWRSRARALILRSPSKPSLHPIKPQPTQKTLTQNSTPPVPNPYKWVLFHNPRFISNDSSSAWIGSASEPGVTENGKNSNSSAPESVVEAAEASPWVFDEGINKDSAFAEEDTSSSPGFDDIVDKGKAFDGEGNPSFDLEGNGEGPDEETPEINEEQVENVLSILRSDSGEPIESKLDGLGLTLSEEFVGRVIRTPLGSGEKLIWFFRWASESPDFVVTPQCVHLLVEAVGNSDVVVENDAFLLWDLIRGIGERESGVLNTEILNGLLALIWRFQESKKSFEELPSESEEWEFVPERDSSLEVFDKFDDFKCVPDGDSYYLTIGSLCSRSMFDSAWSICEKMLGLGVLPDGEKVAKIISWFCKGKRAKDAHLVYLMAKDHDKCPPRRELAYLVISLCKDNDTVRTGLELLEDFVGDSRKYAIKPFSHVLNGLCRINDFEEAKMLLFKMIESGPPPGGRAFNYIITALAKAGNMEDAMAWMKVMEDQGLRPDIYTYTVVVSGFTKGGQMSDARNVFLEAKKRHPKLSRVIYHALIRGYCRLEQFDSALECLNEMKEDGVCPNSDEYDKMIVSLCFKAIDWRTAEKLLEEMKEGGLYLRGITRSLINAVKQLEGEEIESSKVAIEA